MASPEDQDQVNPYQTGNSPLVVGTDHSEAAKPTKFIDAIGAFLLWLLGCEVIYNLTIGEAKFLGFFLTFFAALLPSLAFLALRYRAKSPFNGKRFGWWLSFLIVFGASLILMQVLIALIYH